MLITDKITKLILIAGYGELPIKLAQSAQAQGVEVVVLALNNEIYKEMKDSFEIYKFSPIEIYPMLNKIKDLGYENITFIGKVPKMDFFKNIHKLDKSLLEQVYKLANLNDDSLHLRIVEFLEVEHGLKVIDQTKYLKSCFPGEQVFTKRRPTVAELEEISYGLSMAKGIAALDLGQAVVVKNKSVIAVEAIEGTNQCIKRAVKSLGLFAKSKTITVCKVSKPNQDQRFDVPVIGLQTLRILPKGSILAFEAKECFFLDQEAAIKYADSNDIIIASV